MRISNMLCHDRFQCYNCTSSNYYIFSHIDILFVCYTSCELWLWRKIMRKICLLQSKRVNFMRSFFQVDKKTPIYAYINIISSSQTTAHYSIDTLTEIRRNRASINLNHFNTVISHIFFFIHHSAVEPEISLRGHQVFTKNNLAYQVKSITSKSLNASLEDKRAVIRSTNRHMRVCDRRC